MTNLNDGNSIIFDYFSSEPSLKKKVSLTGHGNFLPGVPPLTDGPEDPGPLDGDGGDGPYASHPGHRPHHPVDLHQADINQLISKIVDDTTGY